MIAVPDGTIRFASGVNRFDVLSAGDAARRGTDGGAVPPTSTLWYTRDPAHMKTRPCWRAGGVFYLTVAQTARRPRDGAAGARANVSRASEVRNYAES